MVTWLQIIGVIPSDVKCNRGNRHPNTNLNPRKIRAGYLAELAHDWDQLGHTSPRDFVNALSFEVSGQPGRISVQTVLAELAMDSMAWANAE